MKKFTKRIRKAIKNWIEDFLLNRGFVKMENYNKITTENQILKRDNLSFVQKSTKLTIENEQLRKQVIELPRDFGAFLARQNPEQINALVYKIINDTRNNVNPDIVSYLPRWANRIEDALNTLPAERQINIKD